MPEQTLGARLKKARRRRGWTQKRLAQEAGISYRVVQTLEQGITQGILLANAIKLAQALGISTDELYGISKQGRRKT